MTLFVPSPLHFSSLVKADVCLLLTSDSIISLLDFEQA